MSEVQVHYYNSLILEGKPVNDFDPSQLEAWRQSDRAVADLEPKNGKLLMLGGTGITHAELQLLEVSLWFGIDPQGLLEFLRRPI